MNDAADLRKVSWASRLSDQIAATSIEYALIASLISVMIVSAATLVGVRVTVLYDAVAKAFP